MYIVYLIGALIERRVYLPVLFWWYDECIYLLCFID